MATISRQEYNNLFGPTVGDKIRLGDTDLYVEIEKRPGANTATKSSTAAAKPSVTAWGWPYDDLEGGFARPRYHQRDDIDANLGVVKADVGVKDGKIAGIGKAGNPNIMHGVHPDLVTSTATDAISGEHLILTAAVSTAMCT